jgi:hypothetical protein
MLEFGKDLWMKYQLPTSHWLYFCVQVKRDKIDSTGSSGGKNVGTILNQARMAIDHPIFAPEANRKVLLDHIYIISANEITRARTWIVENLDAGHDFHGQEGTAGPSRANSGGPAAGRCEGVRSFG